MQGAASPASTEGEGVGGGWASMKPALLDRSDSAIIWKLDMIAFRRDLREMRSSKWAGQV